MKYFSIGFCCALTAVVGCQDDPETPTTNGPGSGGNGAAAGSGGSGGNGAAGATAGFGGGGTSAGTAGAGGATGGTGGGPPLGDVTVTPTALTGVLVNPGMGLANFHFGWWCDPTTAFTPQQCADRVNQHWPNNHPDSGTAYFRWHWRDIEPVREQIDFAMIDTNIQSANLLGETLSFRIMTVLEGDTGLPPWMMSGQYVVAGAWEPGDGGNTFWPDYRDQTFQNEHARLVTALANRYDDHPAVDHIDIGPVGCWGEWNTACLTNENSIIEIYDPQNATERQAIATAYQQLIDHYVNSFTTTPTVMLGIGSGGGLELDILLHAITGGAGWRVDCWGDWGIWGSGWNHHEDDYPQMISNATAAYPAFVDVWKNAPIQLEVCGTMPGWHGLNWTTAQPDGEVYKSFQWALQQHASVLNAKWTDIPADYVAALNEMLEQNGYRFVIDSFNHHSTVTAGSSTNFLSSWSNVGVAPSYLRRTLSYRLNNGTDSATSESTQDIRTWLPGSWQVVDTFTVPANLPAGTYDVEVAIVDRAGTTPTTQALPPLQLGITGRGSDGWYAISQLTVQ